MCGVGFGWGLDHSLGNGVDTSGSASVAGGRQRPCWLRAGREAGGAAGIKLHPPLEWPLRGEAPGAGSKALTWWEVQPWGMFSPISGSLYLFSACGSVILLFRRAHLGWILLFLNCLVFSFPLD